VKASFYISWGEDGTQLNSGDQLLPGASQIAGIVSLTVSESLAPIFATNLAGITDLPAGTNFSGYQVELQNFFDQLTITDVFYTGSLVAANVSNLNFTGSVDVALSGSDGVTINVTGGAGGSGSSGSSGTSGLAQVHQVPQVHQVLQVLQVTSGSSGTSGVQVQWFIRLIRHFRYIRLIR
jgi:hypothetical protein